MFAILKQAQYTAINHPRKLAGCQCAGALILKQLIKKAPINL